MKLLILGCCFLALESHAQIRGQVVNKENEKPIPFTTLRWGLDQGTYSDIEGRFGLPEAVIGQDLIVSCVGYQTDTVRVSPNDFLRIELSPDVLQMFPFVVSDGAIKPIRLGVEKKASQNSSFGGGQGFQVAIFIPNEKSEKKFLIKKAFYHLQGGISGSKVTKPRNSFFRVRIYNLGVDGKPERDLLNRNLIVHPKTNKGWTEVDLSDYWILIPSGGIFVAIEWIEGTPTAEFKYTNQNGKKKVGEDYGSSIKMYLPENKNLRCWYKSVRLGWFNWNVVSEHPDYKYRDAVPGIYLEVIEL